MSYAPKQAQGVLNAFNEYLRAREEFAMAGGALVKDDIFGGSEGELTYIEAQVHLRHNIAKMVCDDPKMALVRDYRIEAAKQAARRQLEDDRIRIIVREVLTEVQAKP